MVRGHPFRPLFVEARPYMPIPRFGVCSMEFTAFLKDLYPTSDPGRSIAPVNPQHQDEEHGG
jgi:hypothetical protein